MFIYYRIESCLLCDTKTLSRGSTEALIRRCYKNNSIDRSIERIEEFVFDLVVTRVRVRKELDKNIALRVAAVRDESSS